ncbi:MAG: nitrous oxide-stimulated promoter family protein [bacterium]|nr:nitrous oxide-stimulated promoter family protein [bacterium]MDT8396599.1 nitrous oxide-stimulated promoter family protein [bacterium]
MPPLPTSDPEYIRADARKLVRFVSMYCDSHHRDRSRIPFSFEPGKTPVHIQSGPPLCDECTALLRHAIVMRVLCPLDPKPKCRKCPRHCYRPGYKEEMERVMKYAGPRTLFHR